MAHPEDQLVLYEPLGIHGGLGKQEVQGAINRCPGEAVPHHQARRMFNVYYNVTLLVAIHQGGPPHLLRRGID